MASPGDDRSRPGQDGFERVDQQQNTSMVGVSTDTLWSLAAQCPPEHLFAISVGYRLGLLERDGYQDGYADAEQHMADSWHRVYLDVHAMAKRPTFAELQRRRAEVA